MDVQTVHDRLTKLFAGGIVCCNTTALDPWIEVDGRMLPDICQWLHDDADLRFDMLHCITGVDYFQPDAAAAAKLDWQPHLEVIYHLSSLVHKHRLVLKVMLERWKNAAEGQLPELPTVSHIWRTADWHEREVYDLMGVRFLGHPDFRRILCPDDWPGHPLRKDYRQPDQYHGIPAR
jgi:NADH-quinone oxidoreductase subunit C